MGEGVFLHIDIWVVSVNFQLLGMLESVYILKWHEAMCNLQFTFKSADFMKECLGKPYIFRCKASLFGILQRRVQSNFLIIQDLQGLESRISANFVIDVIAIVLLSFQYGSLCKPQLHPTVLCDMPLILGFLSSTAFIVWPHCFRASGLIIVLFHWTVWCCFSSNISGIVFNAEQ